MARPTSSLPQAGRLADFAFDLRELRTRAGEPSLADMAEKGSCSTGALSTAMRGKVLPSETVLRAFLAGCDCDDASVDRWLARRSELARLSYEELTQPTASNDSEVVDVESSTEGQERGFLRTNLVPILLIGFIVFVLGGGVGFAIGHATADPQPQATTWHAPRDGDDPVSAGCSADAKTGVAVEQPDGTLVELMWSARCSANWGRITRPDSGQGESTTVVLTGHFANAPNPATRTVRDQQSTFTPLLVMGPTDKACVTGSWTVGEETYEVAEPACG